jgi:hypothetical protein
VNRGARGGRVRDDRGQAGGWEVVPFGLLVFVIGTLLIANVWAVIDAKFAVVDAARAGARAYVRADNGPAAATASSRAAAAAIAAHHRSRDRVTYPGPRALPRFERCAVVVVTVRDTIPALSLPFIGGLGRGVTVVGQQREIVDPYRSGLPAGGACGG